MKPQIDQFYADILKALLTPRQYSLMLAINQTAPNHEREIIRSNPTDACKRRLRQRRQHNFRNRLQ